MIEIEKLFKLHNDEHLAFERVENKLSSRCDLHALRRLDELFPFDVQLNDSTFYPKMVSGCESFLCFLLITPEQIKTLTSEQILELVRCGVGYHKDKKRLCIFG